MTKTNNRTRTGPEESAAGGIENAILGYGLEDYIYGTDQIPPRLIEGNPNPEFIRYHRQDRLLISWILASITPSYLPQLVGYPLPMRDYLMKMKGFFDMLAAADHGMSDTNQVLAILNGLGDEYESIIAIICSKEVPYTLQHVNSLLLSHEGRILQKNSIEMAANYSNFSRRGSNWNGHQNQGGGRNSYGSRGRGRCRSYNNRP
ncbi:hypothetical protein UlMin_046166 [Ulmus minor]